jgi:hypothetical protein
MYRQATSSSMVPKTATDQIVAGMGMTPAFAFSQKETLSP